MQSKWMLRWVTAAVWALAAASAVAWGLRLAGQGGAAGAPVVVAAQRSGGEPVVSSQALAQWLGATSLIAKERAPTLASSRFGLTGVVAQGKNGVALLVVDGKPPKPYAVGSRIDESTLLQAVGPRYAVLAASMDAAAGQRLELPAPLPINVSATATGLAPAPPRQPNVEEATSGRPRAKPGPLLNMIP